MKNKGLRPFAENENPCHLWIEEEK